MKRIVAVAAMLIATSAVAAPPTAGERLNGLQVPLESSHRLHPSRRVLPPRTPADWVRQNSVALSSTDVITDDSDLLPMKAWVHDARVIGLGDGTHGTHEYYKVKNRLIGFLAREEGINIVAFEAPWAEFNKITEYLMTGSGNPRELLHIPGYFFWEYPEMLDLLEWARQYNATRGSRPPLRFIGIDTLPFGSRTDVIAFFDAVDPAYAPTVRSAYACLSGQTCIDAAKEVSRQLRDQRAQYEAASSATRVADVIQSARVVEEYLETQVSPTGDQLRDQYMAENLANFLDAQGGGTRALFWGHNEHLGRTYYELSEDPSENTKTKTAGHFLRDRFGDQYFVIGSCFLTGSFTAYERTRTGLTLASRPMEAPTAENYESFFSQAGVPRLILNLRTAAPPDWLVGPRPLQHGQAEFGTTKNGFNVPVRLLEKFDAIVYLDVTTPTVVLP